MDVVFSPGSVFRITKHYSQDPMKQDQTQDFHVLLAQIDHAKFILVTLNSGRPWLSTPIRGTKEGVKETELSLYLKKTLVDEVVLLGHSSNFDAEELATFI